MSWTDKHIKDSTAMTVWIDVSFKYQAVVAFQKKFKVKTKFEAEEKIEKLLCLLRWLDLDAKL